MADLAFERLGGVDVLVNNVGDVAREQMSWRDITEKSINHVLGVDIKGTLLCVHEFGARMLEAGHGAIVNIGSTVIVRGSARAPQYAAAKYGILGVTKSYAHAFAPTVRVNVFAPGFIETEATLGRKDWQSGRGDQLRSLTPMNRIPGPAELAGTALFLATDDASHMTGGYMVADGGYNMVGAGALELHLVDHGDMHRERGRVHHRQRQRLPLRRQRAAHREEAGHPRLQHPFVHPEGHGRLPPLTAQGKQPLDDGGVGVRPEQPVAEQLEPGGHRPADNRGTHDEPVALGQPLPQPPRVVRLGALRGAAGQPELVEADELDLGTLPRRRAERCLQQDLRAAAGLTAAEPQHSASRAHRRHLVPPPKASRPWPSAGPAPRPRARRRPASRRTWRGRWSRPRARAPRPAAGRPGRSRRPRRA